MSLSIYMKGDYEEFHALRWRKNKPNSKPIADLWPEIRNKLNRCQMAESILKKQSQFLRGINERKYILNKAIQEF